MSPGGHSGLGPTRRVFVGAVLELLTICFLTSVPSTLRAAEISWDGPDECENKTYVAEQAQALSGRSLEAVEGVLFAVRVERNGESWELVLITRSGPGGEARERRLHGKNCAEVSDAAAVAIAMTLGGRDEPQANGEAPQPAAEVEPPPPNVATSGEPKALAKTRRPAQAPGPDGIVAIHAVLDSGALPSVALGADVSAGIAWKRLRVTVEGGVFLPNQTELAEGRGGTFSLAYGALLACFVHSFGASLGSVCAGYEIGSLSGEGEGVDEPHLGSVLWQAPRLELGLGVPLAESIRFSLGLGAAVPLARPEFVLDGGEVVHRPSAITARARAGIELSF